MVKKNESSEKEVNKDVRGRWDIDFVEFPRNQPVGTTIDAFNKAYLIAMAEKHPFAFEELKTTIIEIDLIVRGELDV